MSHNDGDGCMKRIKQIVGVLIIVFCVFLYAHIAKTNNVYDKKIDSSEYLNTGVVCDGIIEQKFVCAEDSLDGVRAKVQVLGDITDVNVRYRLIDDQTGECVAEGIKAATEIKPGRFCEFPFDSVERTKGKNYTIEFENENAEEDYGVGFLFQPKTQAGTELTLSGNYTEGTLVVKTLTNRFDFETFAMLLIIIMYIFIFMKFLYRLFR